MAFENDTPQTLADVLALLQKNEDENPRKHGARVSAITRISHFLHRPPSDVPADVPTLRRLLEELHPVQCGVSAKSLSNIKSSLTDALRAVHALPEEHQRGARSEQWNAFLSVAQSDHQKWGISRFVDFCNANSIDPDQVTDVVIESYHDYLLPRLLSSSPRAHCKAVVSTWNHLVRSFEQPLTRLSWNRAIAYRARPLSEYPESLQTEVDAYLGRLSHADIFQEDGPDKPLRPTSLRNVRAHLTQYLDALIGAGLRPENFACLSDAISADHFKTAFRVIQARHGKNTIHKGLGNIAGTLTAIGRHHLKLPEVELDRMLAIKKRVSVDPRGMSDKNRERLGQFDDWQNVVRLVTLGPALMDRADENPVGRNSALDAMYAAALTILLSCPMRVQNLSSLDLDRHLRPRLNGTHTLYTIRILGSEVKNGEPIAVELNAKSSRLLHRYVTQYRHQVSTCPGTALFPRVSDGKARSPGNFSQALSDVVRRETGLIVHAHLFRHIAAMLYLRERPGDFETVRRLLKHRRLQTTMDFYAPLSNQWAHEQYDKVVLSKFGG